MNTEHTTQNTTSDNKEEKDRGLTITLPLTIALWFVPPIFLFVGTFCIIEFMKYYN